MQRQTYIYIYTLYIYIKLLQVTYPGRGEKVADIDRLAIYHTTPAADAIYLLIPTVVATNLQILDLHAAPLE